jgi:hypothetical protein
MKKIGVFVLFGLLLCAPEEKVVVRKSVNYKRRMAIGVVGVALEMLAKSFSEELIRKIHSFNIFVNQTKAITVYDDHRLNIDKMIRKTIHGMVSGIVIGAIVDDSMGKTDMPKKNVLFKRITCGAVGGVVKGVSEIMNDHLVMDTIIEKAVNGIVICKVINDSTEKTKINSAKKMREIIIYQTVGGKICELIDQIIGGVFIVAGKNAIQTVDALQKEDARFNVNTVTLIHAKTVIAIMCNIACAVVSTVVSNALYAVMVGKIVDNELESSDDN